MVTSYEIGTVAQASNQKNIGPWCDSNGNMYALFFQTPGLAMWKSDDDGQTWSQVDSAGRPSPSNAIVTYSGKQYGDTIHIASGSTSYNMSNDIDILYHTFTMSDHGSTPDEWVITSQTVVIPDVAGHTVLPWIDIGRRSDGDVIIIHQGDSFVDMGNTNGNVAYSIREGSSWTSTNNLINAEALNQNGCFLVMDENDDCHLFYNGFSDNWTGQTLDSSNSLGSSTTNLWQATNAYPQGYAWNDSGTIRVVAYYTRLNEFRSIRMVVSSGDITSDQTFATVNDNTSQTPWHGGGYDTSSNTAYGVFAQYDGTTEMDLLWDTAANGSGSNWGTNTNEGGLGVSFASFFGYSCILFVRTSLLFAGIIFDVGTTSRYTEIQLSEAPGTESETAIEEDEAFDVSFVAPPVEQTLIDDNFTGTNGAPWNTANWETWSIYEGVSTAEATIQSNRGQIHLDNDPLDYPTDPRPHIGIRAKHTPRKNIEISGTVQGVSGNDGALHIWLRAQDGRRGSSVGYLETLTDEFHRMRHITGYKLVWQTSGLFVVYRTGWHTDDPEQEIGWQEAWADNLLGSVTGTITTNYSFRFQVFDDVVRFKRWTGSEPGTWDIDVTDSGATDYGRQPGHVLIHSSNGTSDAHTVVYNFDDIIIKDLDASDRFIDQAVVTEEAYDVLMGGTSAFQENFTGSNGTVWSTTRWRVVREQDQDGDPISHSHTIQSNRGRISLDAPINSLLSNPAYSVIAMHPPQRNIEVTGTITVIPPNTPDAGFVRFNFSNGAHPYYPERAIYFQRSILSDTVTVGANLPLLPSSTLDSFTGPARTSECSFRFRVQDTAVLLKVWTGSEPGTWDVEYSHAGIATLYPSYIKIENIALGGSISKNLEELPVSFDFDTLNMEYLGPPIEFNTELATTTEVAYDLSMGFTEIVLDEATTTEIAYDVLLEPDSGAGMDVEEAFVSDDAEDVLMETDEIVQVPLVGLGEARENDFRRRVYRRDRRTIRKR